MRKLENQTNITPPSADYPDGRIKDDSGAGDGTPVDEKVYGDINQFFAKIARDAKGITPNDLPDNTTNGFQLFQAFYNLAVRAGLSVAGYFDYKFTPDISFTFGATETIIDIWVDEKYIYASVHDSAPTDFLLRADATGDIPGFSLIVNPLPGQVEKIVSDETLLYLAINGVGIKVYNKETGAAVPGLDIPFAYDVGGLSINEGLLYVGNTTDDKVNIYNASTGAAGSDIATGTVNIAGVHAEGNKLYVIQSSTSDIFAYELGSEALLDTVDNGLANSLDLTVYGNKIMVLISGRVTSRDKWTHSEDFFNYANQNLSANIAIIRARLNRMFIIDTGGATDVLNVYEQKLNAI